MEEQVMVTGMTMKQSGRLAEKVEIAIGMKAMVLMNIATEADITNGTRGTIEDIILDSREDDMPNDSATVEVELKYPPAVIIFRPDHASEEFEFEGLAKGLIPIVASEAGFTIDTRQGKIRIHRRQMAITPAYAFTHHKCQGQTIEYVIVDLGTPPGGGLSPFNAYVVLSRSRGRKTIRLLQMPKDSGLFMKHPSESLRDEDERLARLTQNTRN
ncbi:uncharacterized protein ARMOST_06517 [Armillaria ostoyae]|uniref:UvrD-like helicase C-terminal domain-containing protein n=1 Tax=Armillaria ostoyae TaxID=47428 RepID=A0A284R381_ARMOS|nr:uncharacterized protein ARMOST_06517 [Armillaria ostoyae]